MKKIAVIAGMGWIVCFGFLYLGHTEEGPWMDLFDGENLNGWTVMNDAVFEIEQDEKALHLVDGMGWLRSNHLYDDFELKFEIFPLVNNYDSGFYFRADYEGKPWPSVEYQINLRLRALGFLVVGPKALIRVPQPPRLPEEWHSFHLTVNGKNGSLTMDNEPMWETDELEERCGYLGIQAENRAFLFRNIRVKEIGYTNLLERDEKTFKHLNIHAGDNEALTIDPNGNLVYSGTSDPWVIGTKGDNFTDFHLKFDFFVPKQAKGNCDVVIRYPGEGDLAKTGLLIPIVNKKKVEDFYTPFNKLNPIPETFHQAKTWQAMDIIAQENVLKVYINGVPILDAPMLKDRPNKGHIGIQGGGVPVQFRNVSVKRLSD